MRWVWYYRLYYAGGMAARIMNEISLSRAGGCCIAHTSSNARDTRVRSVELFLMLNILRAYAHFSDKL